MTYAAKFAGSDFEIDWSRPAVDIHRLVRVGGAWTTFRGKRLKINAARLEGGVLVPTIVQPEGKARDELRILAQRRPSELPTNCSAPCDPRSGHTTGGEPAAHRPIGSGRRTHGSTCRPRRAPADRVRRRLREPRARADAGHLGADRHGSSVRHRTRLRHHPDAPGMRFGDRSVRHVAARRRHPLGPPPGCISARVRRGAAACRRGRDGRAGPEADPWLRQRGAPQGLEVVDRRHVVAVGRGASELSGLDGRSVPRRVGRRRHAGAGADEPAAAGDGPRRRLCAGRVVAVGCRGGRGGRSAHECSTCVLHQVARPRRWRMPVPV